MTDDIAERARKIGGTTIRSIGDIAEHQRLKDNDEELVTPGDMLTELCADNQRLTRFLRTSHELCDRYNDVATASLIETWIDQTERRTWFLAEIVAVSEVAVATERPRYICHFLRHRCEPQLPPLQLL